MEERELRDLETIFVQVEDPRIERTKQHRLRDIIIIAICGVICGADGWGGIEAFGKAKQAWLTDLLQLPNGIPSHDTFGRVFALIDPKQFEASFLPWVQGISTSIKGVIAIDGKTMIGRFVPKGWPHLISTVLVIQSHGSLLQAKFTSSIMPSGIYLWVAHSTRGKYASHAVMGRANPLCMQGFYLFSYPFTNLCRSLFILLFSMHLC